MAGFLYFIEGETAAVTPEKIEQLGLRYAFPATVECRPCTGTGPGGKAGMTIADPARHKGDHKLGYFPDDQQWRQLPERDGRPPIYLGYWKAAKPTPVELQRGEMLDGLTLELQDGNRWCVPMVRNWDEQEEKWQTELPAYLDYDQHGNIVKGRSLAEYAHLWDLTEPVARALFQDVGEMEITDEDVVRVAVELLKTQYVVDLPELVQLGALADGGQMALVVQAACNARRLLEWIEEIQKKSERPSTETGSGTSGGNAA